MGSSSCRSPSRSIRPVEGPRGPGGKTKLKPDRITQGISENCDNFRETDEWQNINRVDSSVNHPWTGRTIFIVDKKYSKEYGADQR